MSTESPRWTRRGMLGASLTSLTAAAAAPGIAHADEPQQPVTGALVTGDEPGFVSLTADDFTNVNCNPDTWTFDENHVAHCTGTPVGVFRSIKQYTNFEVVFQWMHLKHGGNSGMFAWCPPEALQGLKPGQLPPGGIEIQVLDLGYKENYERGGKRKADWFTCHGDVFAVGQSTMKPFAPISPNGRRSFPTQQRSRGINQWNHYYFRCINGEVRLWVNGVEVSGGNQCNPRTGHLCLESEGAPLKFRNIRLRELP